MSHVRIELWGYPGSGKSTIANRLKCNWGFESLPKPDDPKGGIKGVFKFLIRLITNPKICIKLVKNINNPKDVFHLIHHFKKELICIHIAIRQNEIFRSSETELVLSEGITHHIWRLLYDNPDEINNTWWHKYLLFSGPIIIVLDVDKELIAKRIIMKSQTSNIGKVNKELLHKPIDGTDWERAEKCYKIILEKIKIYHNNHVIIISNNRSDIYKTCNDIINKTNKRILKNDK